MFKIKKTQKRTIPREGEYVTGVEALSVPIGTYLKVLDKSTSNKGDIIIRWYEDYRPFRNVRIGCEESMNSIGGYWGTLLDNYFFQIMYGFIPEYFPEFQEVLKSEE